MTAVRSMGTEVDVSVIVPFFDAEPYIERCIRALLAQDLGARRYEILMVDNNSRDGSGEIVQRYPRVRLLRESRQGAYAARNRALSVAAGGLVAFTDPDCEPRADWLPRLLVPFSDPRVQITVGRSEPGSRSRALALLSAYEHHKDLYIFGCGDSRLCYGRTNNLAARRTALQTYGPFVERMRGSDTIFVRRVTDAEGFEAVRYVPEARTLHLEIDGLGAYFRKVPLYGRSVAGLRQVVEKRGLTAQERAGIVRRAAHDAAIGPLGVVPLLGLLAASVVLERFGGTGAVRGRRTG